MIKISISFQVLCHRGRKVEGGVCVKTTRYHFPNCWTNICSSYIKYETSLHVGRTLYSKHEYQFQLLDIHAMAMQVGLPTTLTMYEHKRVIAPHMGCLYFPHWEHNQNTCNSAPFHGAMCTHLIETNKQTKTICTGLMHMHSQ